MVLDFIVLVIAIFASLLFLVNIIADIVNCRAFVAPEDDRKQREINAKYRITLGLIMSLSWAYVILLI